MTEGQRPASAGRPSGTEPGGPGLKGRSRNAWLAEQAAAALLALRLAGLALIGLALTGLMSGCTPPSSPPRAQTGLERDAPGVAGRVASTPRTVDFGLFGDVPYSDRDEAQARTVLQDMHQAGLLFAIHVGDIKASTEPCTDELLTRRVRLLLEAALPVVLLPGDNEWTDCHRALAGRHDPRERLAFLRRLAWSSPEPRLGSAPVPEQIRPLERQREQPENLRMVIDRLHVLTVHVVGSNNGEAKYPGSADEVGLRMQANQQWLERGVDLALAQEALGLVIGFHADPSFGPRPGAGFEAFQRQLQSVAARFQRPILLVHGDGHRFRIDQPLPGPHGPWPHVTRVETFGWPHSLHWIQVHFDPQSSPAFRLGVRTAGSDPGRGPSLQ
jgi:hypothetical protein